MHPNANDLQSLTHATPLLAPASNFGFAELANRELHRASFAHGSTNGKDGRLLPTNERLSTLVGAGKLGEIADDRLSGQQLDPPAKLGRVHGTCHVACWTNRRPGRYVHAVLSTYPEIRDRIYELARRHGLRPDWVDSTREMRHLLLYDTNQVVVARTRVPVRRIDPDLLARLAHDLETVFGKDWMK
jgi:hypothetical protein